MRLILVFVLVLAAGTVPTAQQAAPETLPLDLTIEQLQARNRTALGGQVAIDALKGLRTKGRLQIEGLDAPGTFEVLEKAPGLRRMTMSIPDGPSMTEGCDGDGPWSHDPDGVTVPTGAELKEALDDCLFLSDIDMNRGFTSLTMVGKSKLRADLTVYLVDGIRSSGRKDVLMVDATSHLVVMVVTEKLEDGKKVQVATGLQDYRPVAGVMVPHVLRVVSPEGKINLIVTSVEPNPAIDDTAFRRLK